MADCLVPFTEEELDDVIEALVTAQGELCLGTQFPESNAYNQRLESILKRLREHLLNRRI